MAARQLPDLSEEPYHRRERSTFQERGGLSNRSLWPATPPSPRAGGEPAIAGPSAPCRADLLIRGSYSARRGLGQLCPVTTPTSVLNASTSASHVRTSVLRSSALTFEKASSMRSRSDEYGGRHCPPDNPNNLPPQVHRVSPHADKMSAQPNLTVRHSMKDVDVCLIYSLVITSTTACRGSGPDGY